MDRRPLAEINSSGIEILMNIGARPVKKEKILICDDMSMIRSLVKKSLLAIGYKNVSEAQDGLDALDKIKTSTAEGHSFDVVFIDWDMPRMTGIEVIEFCKKSDEYKHIPFIMISAERDHKNIVQASKIGAYDYILKPFSPSVLTAKLDKLKNKKAAA